MNSLEDDWEEMSENYMRSATELASVHEEMTQVRSDLNKALWDKDRLKEKLQAMERKAGPETSQGIDSAHLDVFYSPRASPSSSFNSDSFVTSSPTLLGKSKNMVRTLRSETSAARDEKPEPKWSNVDMFHNHFK